LRAQGVRSDAEGYMGKPLTQIQSLLALPALTRKRAQEQWLPEATLRQLRNQRLGKLFEEARKSRYYSNVLPPAADRSTAADRLANVPVLTKRILSTERVESFLTGNAEGLLRVTTSGSTGEPSVFLRTPLEEAEFSARWWRVWSAYGAGPRDRMLNVGRTNVKPRSGAVSTLRKLRVLPGIQNVSVSDPIEKSVRTLCEFKPTLITGFAIGIEAMAQYMLEHRITIPPPKLVICGAMDVTDRCRELVQQAFGAPAINVYATNEFGVIAWECPVRPGVLHINEDTFICEILEGDEPVADGSAGEVVLTSLTLMRMPLIRLRTGDIAARIPGACPCNRGLGCMTAIHGRTAHAIAAPGGRLITAPLLASAFGACGAYDWARRFQVQERENGTLCALVVPSRVPDESERHALLQSLRDVTGGAFALELELRDDLPLAPTGKFQYVIPAGGRQCFQRTAAL
jgi:phenylacetate-CoA ligase